MAIGDATVHIALCVSGKAVDRRRNHFPSVVRAVYESQQAHLLKGLSNQGHLDVFYVLDAADAADTAVVRMITAMHPREVVYANTTNDETNRRQELVMIQFERMAVCLTLFRQAEAVRGMQYDWMVRFSPLQTSAP